MDETDEDVYEELAEGAMELYESDVPEALKWGVEDGEGREHFGADDDHGPCPHCDSHGVIVVCREEVCRASGVCFHDGGTAPCPSCGGEP